MLDPSSNNTPINPAVQVIPVSHPPDRWNFKYLHANASLPLLACSIFFASSLVHLSMLVISKRFFMLPLIAGLLLQTAGQIFKIISLTSTTTSTTLHYYILYSLVTSLVPCLFLTSFAWMLQRMMRASNPVSFPLIVKIAAYQIIGLEIVSFCLNAYGLIVQANPSLVNFWNGVNLMILIGLAIELLNFLWVWLALSIILWRKTRITTPAAQKQFSTRFWAFATVITISVSLMMIRTISRFVFQFQHYEIEPFRNELLSFLLQSLPIALCAIFLMVFHPYRYDSGIPEQENAFYSAGAAMIAPLGSELGSSRGTSMNRLSHSSDPFWAVPLMAEPVVGKPGSPHIQLVDHSYPHTPGFPSDSSGYNTYPSQLAGADGRPDPLESQRSPALAVDENFQIDRKIVLRRSPELNDLIIVRNSSQAYLELNVHSSGCPTHPTGTPVSQLDEGSPVSRLEGYSIASYYDDRSNTLMKEWPDNVDLKSCSPGKSTYNGSVYSGLGT